MKVDNNAVIVAALFCAAVMGTISIATGHDQLEVSMGAILTLAGVSQIPRKSDLVPVQVFQVPPTSPPPVVVNGPTSIAIPSGTAAATNTTTSS